MPNPLITRTITPEEIKTYEEDGVVCLRQLFSPEWVTTLQEAAEASLAQPGELHAELAELRQEKGRFFHDTFIWRRNATCRDFVFNSPAGRLAASVLQSEKVNIFFDQWLIKEPSTTTKTPWHHDMTYWPINGRQIATLWLALDSVTAESGAVEYIKGVTGFRQFPCYYGARKTSSHNCYFLFFGSDGGASAVPSTVHPLVPKWWLSPRWSGPWSASVS